VIMSEEQLAERQPLLSAEDLEHTSVYPTIHMIKEDVIVRVACSRKLAMLHEMLTILG
jgi:hypothetical protein